MDKVYLIMVDLHNYPCDVSYPAGIFKTFEGAVKALNEMGPQKWTEKESMRKGEDTWYFEPDFVPDEKEHAPIESASITMEELGE